MADRIKLLSEFVANQIAAGEVVNRPASVVKEMMENAVDAGATSITVVFREGGREMIQVIDDGCGMSVTDARLAFDRHATSKISDADDLYSLGTFGFRGEALPSISAVAEVGLRTRREEDELGTCVEIAGGRFVQQEPVSCPQGSQFTVRNLFYNVPARRRFLDKSSTEARHIITEYQRVALCNPDVAFALYDGDAPLSKLQPGSLRQRITGVMGQRIAKELSEVGADTSIVRVEGFVGGPGTARQSNREQFLFVNGRYFKSPYFHKAIVGAYEKLIPHNTQPSYFLYLTLDPASIDVNVHPQKTEIKFENNAEIWQIINAAVREALAKSGVVPPLDFDLDTSVEIPIYRKGVEYRVPEFRGNPDFNPFRETQQMDVMEFIERGQGNPQMRLDVEAEPARGAVLTIGGRYAVTAYDGSLLVIDMRRAKEAILYERYSAVLSGGCAPCQQLLFPDEIVLSTDDVSLLRERIDDFAAFGFDIAIVGDHTAQVRGVPADFAASTMEETVYELLDAIRDETVGGSQLRRERVAAAMARLGASSRAAEDAETLTDAYRACGMPAFTPGGNAVMRLIGRDELGEMVDN